PSAPMGAELRGLIEGGRAGDRLQSIAEAERSRERVRMPRISYYPVERIEDPELRAILDHAARHGTPRPESQAIRAHVPATLRDFWMQWEATFRQGVCDHAIKELCRVYVSRTVECLYCGSQRSGGGREQGLSERDY